MRSHPTPSVIIASVLFALGGIILIFGLVKSLVEIPFISSNFHIFIIYAFLALLCLFISFGLYRHKKWSLYTGYAFGLYLIVNFVINLNSSFAADIAIAGIPLLLIICVVIGILVHKHKHFIH